MSSIKTVKRELKRFARRMKYWGMVCGYPGTNAEHTLSWLLVFSARTAAGLIREDEKHYEEMEKPVMPDELPPLLDYGLPAQGYAVTLERKTILNLAEMDYYKSSDSSSAIDALDACDAIIRGMVLEFVYAGKWKRTLGFIFTTRTGGDDTVYFVRLSDWIAFIRYCARVCVD